MVIFALLQTRIDLSYVGNVVQNILLLVNELDRVTCSWIRRAGNVVAHRLATFAFSRVSAFFSFRVPNNIIATVEPDLLVL